MQYTFGIIFFRKAIHKTYHLQNLIGQHDFHLKSAHYHGGFEKVTTQQDMRLLRTRAAQPPTYTEHFSHYG